MLRCYANQPTEEFIADLREAAIRANAKPAVIDAIDELRSAREIEDSNETLQNEIEILEAARDDLLSAIVKLLAVLPVTTDSSELRAIKETLQAFERVGGSTRELLRLRGRFGL